MLFSSSPAPTGSRMPSVDPDVDVLFINPNISQVPVAGIR